jgi:putative hydrolase of the HAD superfamily
VKYKHLFFDLDGTLWDLRRNTRIALEAIYADFSGEGLLPEHFEHFYRRYIYHNDQVWALYREGKIEKHVLRVVRFERAFLDIGFTASAELCDRFADAFLDLCPRQPHLLPGALEVLDYCKKHYTLHIITNGFKEVQGIKMAAGKLDHYFTHVINSEDAGFKKPHAGIFQHAFALAGTNAAESLMIGDDWDADILGARNIGMDQIFLTTTEDLLEEVSPGLTIRHNYKPTATISALSEMIDFLERNN